MTDHHSIVLYQQVGTADLEEFPAYRQAERRAICAYRYRALTEGPPSRSFTAAADRTVLKGHDHGKH